MDREERKEMPQSSAVKEEMADEHGISKEQDVFSVQPVTTCTSSIQAHADSVLSVFFSPNGRHLASSSGDKTIRLFDITTETSQYICKDHIHWVLCIAWSPNGLKLASGCKAGEIYVWDASTGKKIGSPLVGHLNWINGVAWEPLHKNGECRRLASASKDCTVRVWDVVTRKSLLSLSPHMASVTCLKWGGSDLIYSGSQDRTIKVHQATDGILCYTLKGHDNWVTAISLNTDFITRTGVFDPSKAGMHYWEESENKSAQLEALALQRYEAATAGEPKRMISSSDDCSMILWAPEKEKKLIARMTGHCKVVIDVKFSPDMKMIASASFDKSIKLWDGRTGQYLASLDRHSNRVYQISWSADSRLLVSGSADSTVNLWDAQNFRLIGNLCDHSGEIYSVDWSPDGQCVASGGQDRLVKIWRP